HLGIDTDGDAGRGGRARSSIGQHARVPADGDGFVADCLGADPDGKALVTVGPRFVAEGAAARAAGSVQVAERGAALAFGDVARAKGVAPPGCLVAVPESVAAGSADLVRV